MHSVIEASLELRKKLNIQPRDIARVTVSGSELLLARGDREVRNERDARVSIQHCCAIAFVLGKASADEFSLAAAMNPDIDAARQRVHVSLDPDISVGGCRVDVETSDGRSGTVSVLCPRGSVERPLTDHDLEKKFEDNARRGGFSGNVTQQLDAIWQMDAAKEIGEMMRLMVPNRA